MAEELEGTTTIVVSRVNHSLLASLGKYGETMDDIIGRILVEKGVKKQ